MTFLGPLSGLLKSTTNPWRHAWTRLSSYREIFQFTNVLLILRWTHFRADTQFTNYYLLLKKQLCQNRLCWMLKLRVLHVFLHSGDGTPHAWLGGVFAGHTHTRARRSHRRSPPGRHTATPSGRTRGCGRWTPARRTPLPPPRPPLAAPRSLCSSARRSRPDSRGRRRSTNASGCSGVCRHTASPTASTSSHLATRRRTRHVNDAHNYCQTRTLIAH